MKRKKSTHKAYARETFDRLRAQGGDAALIGAGWEYCQGDLDDIPGAAFISHPDCPGGWELWQMTERGAGSGNPAHWGEAVLMAGPF